MSRDIGIDIHKQSENTGVYIKKIIETINRCLTRRLKEDGVRCI